LQPVESKSYVGCATVSFDGLYRAMQSYPYNDKTDSLYLAKFTKYFCMSLGNFIIWKKKWFDLIGKKKKM